MEQKKYRKGHFVGLWMAIGIAMFSGMGLPLAIATDNMGLIGVGPAIGVAIGVAIGSAIEKRKAEEGLIDDSPDPDDKTRQTKLILLVVLGITAVIGVVVALVLKGVM